MNNKKQDLKMQNYQSRSNNLLNIENGRQKNNNSVILPKIKNRDLSIAEQSRSSNESVYSNGIDRTIMVGYKMKDHHPLDI